MMFSTREISPSVAALEAARAKVDLMASEYHKKRQDSEAQVQNEKGIVKNEMHQIEAEIDRLKRKLEKTEQKFSDIDRLHEQATKYADTVYKRQLTEYITSFDAGPGNVAREQADKAPDDPVEQVADEIIVVASDDDQSEQDASHVQAFPVNGSAPMKLARSRPVDDETRTRKRQRGPIQTEELSESEHSDFLQCKRLRSGRQVNASTPEPSPVPVPQEKEQRGAFKGVVSPDIGGIYKIQPTHGPGYAAVVLPTGDFDVPGISMSLRATRLWNYIPSCYEYNMWKEIIGWKKGYEDDGPRVTDRKFPVMRFDRLSSIPLEGRFTAAKTDFRWVAAKNIRPLDVEANIARTTGGYKMAKRFMDRMNLFREAREKWNQDVTQPDSSTVKEKKTDGQIPAAASVNADTRDIRCQPPAGDPFSESVQKSATQDHQIRSPPGADAHNKKQNNRCDLAAEHLGALWSINTFQQIYGTESLSDKQDTSARDSLNDDEQQQILDLLLAVSPRQSADPRNVNSEENDSSMKPPGPPPEPHAPTTIPHDSHASQSGSSQAVRSSKAPYSLTPSVPRIIETVNNSYGNLGGPLHIGNPSSAPGTENHDQMLRMRTTAQLQGSGYVCTETTTAPAHDIRDTATIALSQMREIEAQRSKDFVDSLLRQSNTPK
ncbi:hypothetical protein GGR54DRAFT_455885 [Hypoxylon sp. NC1633]|nr:hypothetical protein GGR54DRAFT_455885 [Hypoxylon sp. NC1633]